MSVQLMQKYAEDLDKSGVGYDQGDRWSFNPARDGKSIIPYKDCDCSSSTAAIIRAGGYDLDTRDPIYTGNFYEKAKAAGFEAINVKGKTLSEIVGRLRQGDCLLGPGHIIFAATPNKWWSAENDEYRRSAGGNAGDQTGLEARFRSPYSRSRGWEWILRPPNTVVPDVPPLVAVPKIEGVKPRTIPVNVPNTTFVRIIQEITGAAVDGQRGKKTIEAVKRLQKRLGVQATGNFGPVTAEKYLLSVPNLYAGRGGMPSGAVKLLQWIVRSRVDGQFGGLTTADLKSAQIWAGLEPDGNAGDETKRRITF